MKESDFEKWFKSSKLVRLNLRVSDIMMLELAWDMSERNVAEKIKKVLKREVG